MPLTLHLDAETEKRLKEAAAARGVTPEAFAAEAVEAWTTPANLLWAEDLRRLDEQGDDTTADDAAIAAFERDGLAVPGEEVVAWLKSLQTDAPLPEPEPRPMK